MAEFRVKKIRNVPIAVTPEGFWCCPAPVAFQKTVRNLNTQTKAKSSAPPPSKASTVKAEGEKRIAVPQRSRVGSEDQRCSASDSGALGSANVVAETAPKLNSENAQRKISVGFGQPESSDLKVVLTGKEGIAVKMSVHKNVVAEHSSFFAERMSGQFQESCLEIEDCEDVEIYVETVGLMYCKEVKQRLIRQSVGRVLRILKVAETLGFQACMKSCLAYLEAVPWVGDEEENVVSSIRNLKNDNHGVSPILKRVSSDIPNPPNDTLARILELVLKSNEDRSRREMKSLVLKLLKENSHWTNGSVDICTETLYSSCRSCLGTLLTLFQEASEPGFVDKPLEVKDPILRQIALEADNLLWLVEILADRHVVDEFALMWANQNDLAALHPKLTIVSRHLVSCITARLFVAVGRGEMLPSKDTRQTLLEVWLKPLIDDYSWLQHGCRTFDRKAVEEGIGRTILTLPLEDQQSILLSWLGIFLKVGDNCPNLQRAFEIWWRRTFIRPFVEQQGTVLRPEQN